MFVLMFYIPANNCSIMSGQQQKKTIKCLAPGPKTESAGDVFQVSNPSIHSLMFYQLSDCAPCSLKILLKDKGQGIKAT